MGIGGREKGGEVDPSCHSIYIYKPKNVPERETTRMFLNSQIENLLLLSRSIATTHVLRRVEKH